MIQSLHAGATAALAMEAVATMAMGHPEWDTNELKSWHDWNDQSTDSEDEGMGSGES
jgi:hypothetical protein